MFTRRRWQFYLELKLQLCPQGQGAGGRLLGLHSSQRCTNGFVPFAQHCLQCLPPKQV